MNEQPGVADWSRNEAEEYGDYASSEQRRTLFRVLAANLVRELRSSGYHGSDLLGFVAQLMEAVTDAGFGAGSATNGDAPGSAAGTVGAEVRFDEWGRPSIDSDRVLLRPPTAPDRAALERWGSDPVVHDSLAPALLERILGGLSDPPGADRLDLVMCDVDSGTPFGAVSLHHIDAEGGQAEVGKMIGDPRFRGRGLAGVATVLLLRHAFEALELNRVYLRTLGGNLKNIRLNERIGFRFEGVLRSAFVRDGKARDVVLMGLLRHEFEELYAGGDVEASPV